jgi:L-lactate dehydrogenase complex protein LldF
VVNKMFKGWNTHRSNLNFSGKTFNQLWKEKGKAES